MCQGSVIYSYDAAELHALTYGTEALDFAVLRQMTTYEAGYTADSPQMQWLWQILLEEFDEARRCAFLYFVTGSRRAPIIGLRAIGQFVVVRCGGDSDRLPSAHTCFNTLLMNAYGSKEKLKRLLEVSLDHIHGFGLF